MIGLEIEPYCSSCLEFYPHVDKKETHFETFDGETEIVIDIKVSCKHRKRCQGMMRYLKGTEKNG